MERQTSKGSDGGRRGRMFSWSSPSRMVLLGLFACFLLLFAGRAEAGFIWLNSNYFGANSSIVATTGQVSYITGCSGGIDDFFYPWANLYVVPAGVGAGAELTDVSGSPNVVQYVLIDEVIGNTGPGGNIPSGHYAVILDECQDNKYDPGLDYYEEIWVNIPSNIDSFASAQFAASLASTKAAATQQQNHWAGAAKHMAALFAYYDVLTAISIATDPADFLLFACTNINLDTGSLYCSVNDAWAGLITLQNNVLNYILNYSFHFKGIAADPPDPNFEELPVLAAPFTVDNTVNDPVHQHAVELGALVSQGDALAAALLTAMERYQGAEQAGMGEHAWRQAQEAEAYARALAAALPRINAGFSSLATEAEASGEDFVSVMNDFRSTQTRVGTTGLTATERTKLLAAGWSEQNIGDGVVDYLARDFSGLATPTDLSTLAAAMAADEAGAIAALTAFADDMAAEQAALDGQLRLPFPTASAGGPYTANEGVALTLDASGTTHPDYANTDPKMTYAWDLNLDGIFDDAVGMNPTVTFDRERDGYVGVQVTAPNGFQDVAYTRVTVNDVNGPPDVTGFSPLGAATIPFDGSQAFSVTATDPDGDPLAYAWDLDGDPVGTGTAYTYVATMADVGEHVVTVTVSDGLTTSADARNFWRLTVTAPDGDGDGFPSNVDCDDTNPAINPGQPEVALNGIDDDCDPATPDNPDVDGDTYDYTIDCDDTDPAVHPGALEVCNGIDDNCDGTVDEGYDADGDGFTTCAVPTPDCNDADPAVFPGAVELCNLADDNCNGSVDEGLDTDGDGVTVCAGDCDDGDAAVFPGNTEVCDSKDNDCNGAVDEGFDADGDGFTICATPTADCNDADPNTYPGAVETCDSADNNCNGSVDEGVNDDNDLDGYSVCAGDCNDAQAAIHPGAVEACNLVDDDCNGTIDDGFDADGDGFTTCAVPVADCADGDPSVYPGRLEIFHNGKDDDCDVTTKDDYADTFIIAPDDQGRLYYARSNGDGTWAGYQQVGQLSGYIRGVAIADYDGDGDLDFVTGSPSGQTTTYYLFANDGVDHFTNVASVGTGSNAGSYQMDMTAGDFDNDGDVDFIGQGNSRYVHYGANDGSGHFTITSVDIGFGSYGRGIDVADFDHDGNLDFVRASYSSGQIVLFRGNGDFTFTNAGVIGDPGGDPYGIAAADFNEDGHPDVLANAGGNGDAYFYAGNGDGTFQAGVYVGSVDFNNHGAYDAYDFNRDGHQDLVASSYTSRKLYYYPGNGDGTFGAQVVINPSNTAGNILGISAPPGPPPAGDPIAVIVPDRVTDVAGATVALDGSFSQDDGTLVAYDWDFGDGATGTGTAVNHPYPNAEGVYVTRLSVTDDTGRVGVAAAPVTLLGQPPVADSGGPYVFGEAFAVGGVYTVTLDGSGSTDDSAIVAYDWTFGDTWSDDFADGLPDGWTPTSGTWFVDAGAYRQSDPGPDRSISLRGDPAASDYTFEADVVLEAGWGEEAMLFVRSLDANNRYEYILRGRGGTNDLLFARLLNGSWSQRIRVVLPFSPDYNTTYHLKVEAEGSLFRCYFNGDLVATVSDNTIAHGQAGLATYRTSARFDNVAFSSGARESGVSVTHTYGLGTYPAALAVTDSVGQTDTDATTVDIVAGAPPVADPGGPYAPTEANASCGNWTVAFDGTGSTDDNGIYRYEWDFGDGATGTGATPSHTYAGSGPYTVTLTVTDHALQTDTVTTTVQGVFGAPPVADPGGPYRFDESAASAGLWTVVLMGGGSTDDTGVCDYQWDFGDGSSGTGAAPSHQYAASGIYTVSLTVRDNALQPNTTTGTVEVTVNDPPVAVHGGPYAIDEHQAQGGNFTASFDATASSDDFGVWTYAWDFGDGSTDSGATPTHTYAAPGTYTVSLTVTDNGRQETTASTLIAVTPNGGPVANAGPDQTVEVGQTVTLDATGSTDDVGIYTYRWDFGASLWDVSPGTLLVDGEATITGTNAWGSRYLVTRDTFDRIAGASFTGRLRTEPGGNRHVMWGLKSPGTDYNYTRFPYAIYFTNNAVQIYEDGSYRGAFGTFVDNTDYDLRIDLKTAGAAYYYRETGGADWTLLYDSTYSTETPLQFGATVNSGVIHLGGFAGPGGAVGLVTTVPGPYGQVFANGSSLAVAEVAYQAPGIYTPVVEVSDHALQTDADTADITVVLGAPPSADAGGPYLTNVDIPTRFNGRASTDDFGIRTYAWDFGDGESLESRNPWADHRYTSPSTYTAKLTTTDYAGQSAIDTFSVTVSPDPVVACVPWAFSGGLEVPHDTWSGRTVTLKGVAWSLDEPLTYQWNFGDGSAPAGGTVTDKKVIQAAHTYTGVDGAPFVATLTVTDATGRTASDNYLVRIRARSLDIEINAAIDDGLWWLHANQNRGAFAPGTYGAATIDTGWWDNAGGWGTTYSVSPTASAVQALEINAHLELGDVREDPYVETVARGLRFLPSHMRPLGIGPQKFGDPDTNANGIGVETTESRPVYEMGQAMDCLVASGNRGTYAITGPAGVIDRSYDELVTDMMDAYAWGQDDNNTGGGWRYSWHSWPDNSAAQWGAIGMLAGEEVWGHKAPQWVKDRNNVWLGTSYNGTGFGYTGAGNGNNTTPSGMVQLAFDDVNCIDDPATPEDDRDPRWATAEDYIASQWDEPWWHPNTTSVNNQFTYYGYYAFTKAMRSAYPEPITNLHATGLDWFKDETRGIARRLVDRQQGDGAWPRDQNPGWYVGYDLTTAWSVIILTPTLFVQPPVADAGEDRVWGVDVPITLDGSRSYHLDPFRDIVLYEWDINGDGTYDTSSTEPTTTVTYASVDYPEGDLPANVTVRLRVTDNNAQAKTDTDTAVITIAVPPHPPVADAGGPYTCTLGLPCTLDGSGSFDIDPTDSITLWEWDTNNDGTFGDATGMLPVVTFTAPGIQNVGLRVWDNAVLNDLDGDGVQDPEERLSDHDFTTVNVVANAPPVADANGPYTVDEGGSTTLDGSGSSDPNGDLLTYAWDLDNDGAFDDATGTTPGFAGSDDGTYTVGLEVSDGLLTATATSQVIVGNVAPSVVAGAGQTLNEGGTASLASTFTDPGVLDTHTAIVDWGDGSAAAPAAVTESGGNGSVAGSHTYADNGTYTVTVTVTDKDGGIGTGSLTVVVHNVAPAVTAGADVNVLGGAPVVLAPATFADPGVLDTHTATVDWGDGTPVETAAVTESAGNGSAAATHSYGATGTFTVTVTVTDKDGGVGTDTFTVDLGTGNHPPVADANGPYTVNEGATATLDGSGSSDPDGDGLTYAWDLDNDGVYDDATGAAPSFGRSDDGIFTVDLQVSDGSLTDTSTTTVTVDNVAPAVNTGPDQTVDEGSVFSGAGSFADPGADTWTAAVDYGAGSGVQALALNPDKTFGLAHTYADNGAYTVTVTVTDDDNGAGSDTLVVTVRNVAPTVDAGPDQTVVDGDTVSFAGSFTDPGTADIHAIAWDFGDGANAAGTLTPTHVYTGPGTYTVTLTVTDDDGGVGADTLRVSVGAVNHPPVADANGPYMVDEGATTTLDGSGSSDPDGDGLTYAWDLDNDGVYDDATGAAPSFGRSDDGIFTVGLQVFDGSLTDTATTTVTVDNVAPTVDAGPDQAMDEGSVFAGAGSFGDPGADTWTATAKYGDGSATEAVALNPGKTFTLEHTYVDDGTYTVTVRVTDDDGSVGIDTLSVTVRNVAPAVDAGPDQTVNEGDTVSFAGSFTDPGTADTHAIAWDFGDGATASGTLTPTHQYAGPGAYTVTLTVTDDDGGVGSATLMVTVAENAQQTVFDLTARAKDSKIDIVWSPVAGADSYNVYRSTTPGGPYTLIQANHVTTYCTYADFGLTNGTTYYYVVTSVAGGAESLHSNGAAATPSGRTRR